MMPTAELVFALAGDGRTFVRAGRVRAPLAFTRAFAADDPATALAWLQSTSGGLQSGDHVAVRIVVEAGASAWVAPQSATVVHGAVGGVGGRVTTELVVESGAHLTWAPPPTILLPGARLESATTIHAAGDASVVVGEQFTCHVPARAACTSRGSSLSTALHADLGGRIAADRALASGAWPVGAHGSIWALGAPAELADELLDAGFPAGALPNDAGVGVRLAGSVGELGRSWSAVLDRMPARAARRAGLPS